MTIETFGRKYKTLSDDIYVNEQKVYRVDVNNQKVYPDDAPRGRYILAIADYGNSHYHKHDIQDYKVTEWEGGSFVDYKTIKGELDYQWRLKYAATFTLTEDAPKDLQLSYKQYVPPSEYENVYHRDFAGVSDVVDLYAGTVGDTLSLPPSTELFAVREGSQGKYRGDVVRISELKEINVHPPIRPCAKQSTNQLYEPSGDLARTFTVSDQFGPSIATSTILLGDISNKNEHLGSSYFPGRVGAVATSVCGIAIVNDFMRYYSTIRYTVASDTTDNINPGSHSVVVVTAYAPIDQIIYCGNDRKLASVERVEFTEHGYELLY